MCDDEQQQYIGQAARTLQIIVGALIAGVLILAVVAIVQRGDRGARDGLPILTYTGVALACAGVVASLIVPKIAGRTLRNSTAQKPPAAGARHTQFPASLGEVGPLLANYQTLTIIAAALLEGPAFLNAIAYLIEGQIVSLPVVAALIFCLAWLIPTRQRISDWLTREQRLMEEERQFGNSQ